MTKTRFSRLIRRSRGIKLWNEMVERIGEYTVIQSIAKDFLRMILKTRARATRSQLQIISDKSND